jgi:uncharacterized protein (DUF924 family)
VHWPEELLDYWFARELGDAQAVLRASARWFGGAPAFDAELRARFGELPERALRGELAGWRSGAHGALARVLALDQLPRNLYRGSAQAFAFDGAASAEAQAALAAGLDRALHPVQAAFLYLPFEHAEELALQERSVELFAALQARAPAELAPLFEEYSDYARRHRAVIARFGRFPHRNAALGREPSAQERTYLAAGGEDFAAPESAPAPAGSPAARE